MTLMTIGPGASPGALALGPGDILEISGPLTGQLFIEARGTATSPVIIRPAGERTELNSTENVLVLQNPHHVEVHNLDIVGTDDGDGVLVWVTEPGATGVRLHGLSVRGARNGIAIGSAEPDGLGDVEVSHCLVSDCLLQGILTFGPDHPHHGLHDVRVTHCRVEGTRGDPELENQHSGSGIILGSVRGGEISDCHAHANGAECRATEGPEGIFLHDCSGVGIFRCRATDNQTGGPADGGGLGIDLRCEDCIIEDCTATGNDGAGVLLWNLPGLHSGKAIVRNNHLAGNCRRTSWHGEITVAPSMSEVELIGNLLEPGRDRVGIVTGLGAGDMTTVDNLLYGINPVQPVVIRMHGHT